MIDDSLNALSGRVIGAAIEVHRQLGPGFTEALYEEALADELRAMDIAFLRQVTVPVFYKGRAIGDYRLDLLVERRLIIELKAVEMVLKVHEAQLLSYLRLMRLPLGLLINFNVHVLRHGMTRLAA